MRNKRILLELSKKIGEASAQEAIGQVLNMICSIEEKGGSKEELLEHIFIARQNTEILSGFNNAEYEINNLISNILCISKLNGKIMMNNKEYDNLSFEEFKYVISWSRRIALTANDKISNVKNNRNKNNYNNNIKTSKKSFNNNKGLSDNKFDERWAVLKNLNIK